MVTKPKLATASATCNFRSMLFWMVTKQVGTEIKYIQYFRSMLFWMVTKLAVRKKGKSINFRSMLFWMVTKLNCCYFWFFFYFRSMLFWMVTKHYDHKQRDAYNFRSMLFWMDFIIHFFTKRKLKKPKIRKQMKSRVGFCRKYKMFEVKLYDFTW